METDQHISRLLRLKRYERPPAGYHETFLREFHRRQRMAAMRKPWHLAAWERVTTFWASLANVEVPAFAYATVAAVALAVSVAVVTMNPDSGDGTLASTNIYNTPDLSLTPKIPIYVNGATPVSLTNAPEHDILESRPASNESPNSF